MTPMPLGTIVALILSTISLTFSGYQFFDARTRDIESKQSKIELSAFIADEPLTVLPIANSATNFVVRVTFAVDVANTGLVGDTMTDWYFKEIDPRNSGVRTLYEHNKPVLLHLDRSEVKFPVSVAARESKSFLLSVGLKTDGTEMIKKGYKFPLNAPIKCTELQSAYIKNNLHFLGEFYNYKKGPAENGTEISSNNSLGIGFYSKITGWNAIKFSASGGCPYKNKAHTIYLD